MGSLAHAVHLSVYAIFLAFLRLSIIVRGTSQHRSSPVKKDGVSHETFQTDLWPGAHPNWCIPRKLYSHWNRREWNLNRLRCWDWALVPLPHLRPWPQKKQLPTSYYLNHDDSIPVLGPMLLTPRPEEAGTEMYPIIQTEKDRETEITD